jgi:hypothetical protein
LLIQGALKVEVPGSEFIKQPHFSLDKKPSKGLNTDKKAYLPTLLKKLWAFKHCGLPLITIH